MKHKVNIKGAIISNDEEWIYDMFEVESTSPRKVAAELERAEGKDIEVVINSGGGSVFDGSEIYTALKEYEADVEVKIVGVAASAASLIAMAGKTVKMSPTAQIMIHNASLTRSGDYRSMDQASTMLKNVNQTISNAYKLKSGKSEEELLAMMDNETWLTPQQALDNKFIDEILFEDKQMKMSANLSPSNVIPQQVIDGVRKGMLKNKESNQEYITKDTLESMLADLKNDLQNTQKPKKEPTPEPVKNSGLSKLFLKL